MKPFQKQFGLQSQTDDAVSVIFSLYTV
jgi:hypothetical protein